MAVQLSSYLWLRNNDFRNMLEHPDYRPRLDDVEKSKLKAILGELDSLHSLSDTVDDDSLLEGPNVIVSIQKRVLERSRNRNRSGELFLEIHGVLRRNFVEPEVYRGLLDAHKELDIEPSDEDFKRALEHGTELSQRRNGWINRTGRVSGSRLMDYFCWDVELKREGGPIFYRPR